MLQLLVQLHLHLQMLHQSQHCSSAAGRQAAWHTYNADSNQKYIPSSYTTFSAYAA
jgi:hypothetical protein